MIRELKKNFLQLVFISIIWLAILLALFNKNYLLDEIVVLRMLGVSVITGIIFGIIYPYLWEFSTSYITVKISSSVLASVGGGYLCIYLLSVSVFNVLFPYIRVVFIVVLLGHIMTFYIYNKVKTYG